MLVSLLKELKMHPFLVLAAKAIASSEAMKQPGAVAAMRKAVDVLNDATAQQEKAIQEAEAKLKKNKSDSNALMKPPSQSGNASNKFASSRI